MFHVRTEKERRKDKRKKKKKKKGVEFCLVYAM